MDNQQQPNRGVLDQVKEELVEQTSRAMESERQESEKEFKMNVVLKSVEN